MIEHSMLMKTVLIHVAMLHCSIYIKHSMHTVYKQCVLLWKIVSSNTAPVSRLSVLFVPNHLLQPFNAYLSSFDIIASCNSWIFSSLSLLTNRKRVELSVQNCQRTSHFRALRFLCNHRTGNQINVNKTDCEDESAMTKELDSGE